MDTYYDDLVKRYGKERVDIVYKHNDDVNKFGAEAYLEMIKKDIEGFIGDKNAVTL